jgi:hypothetical protein
VGVLGGFLWRPGAYFAFADFHAATVFPVYFIAIRLYPFISDRGSTQEIVVSPLYVRTYDFQDSDRHPQN